MYSRTEKYHGRRAQRFSIRKYSFGAASVLLGTALLLGTNAVKADETNVLTTKATEITNPDKQKPDSAITTPVVEELPELKLDVVKADEKPEVKEEAKTEATPVAEKEITDKAEKEKSDKEQADKKEVDKEKAETVKPKDEVKSVLTQLTSEAEVMATVASNFSDKEAKDVEAKQKLSAAIAAVKLEAVAAKGLLYSNDSTEEQLTAQVNRISSAIEAVYAEMKRAGHAGKVEAVLGATDAKDQTITGKGVIRNGNAIVTVNNAYVTMNADNTAPKAWGIDVVFDTSQAQNGDTTTIEMKNLTGFGDSFKPGTKITAADGTVIGEVSSKETTNSVGSRGGESPFWSQRKKDGKTYEERLAEQPAIPNEVGTTTYTIRWNDKAKNYAVTTFYAENLTAIDYYAPNISKDTEYTAAISVNGQQILEHKYTHKASKSAAQKQNTSATIMGDNILGYKGSERVRKSDAVVINTDSDVRYGKGSKFTITLPNDDFTYFKTIDGSKNTATNTNKADSISYRPAGRWNNVQANANNVWILNDGRDTNFTLKATIKSPTELEIEVIDGAIQEDSIVSIGLDKLGVEKAITNRTFSDEYSKFIYDEAGRLKDGSVVGDTDKTAATLTVSGGTPLNGGEENVTTKVANGWKVEVGAGGNSQFETGAVTITLVNIETGEEFAYEPTSYDGYAKPNEDGSYETKNILGKKYDVSNQVPDLTKTIKGVEYIRVDVPSKGTTGTVNIGPKRASAIYSSEELQANGVNPNAFVNNVVYYYVKKTKVEEVNRTIKYVYADDVKDLAGQEVFEPTKQTVSYTGTIQVNDKNEAQVDANRKPIYINWVGNGDTNLPELAVPKKEGYIASVEKVPVQATTATDEDYEYVVKYTAIQKAKTTFVDEKGNGIPGVAEITEQGGSETPLTKEADVKAKIKELENKGYELVSNTYPEGGKFDTDKDTDQEFKVTLKAKEVTVTPDQPKTPGTPVDPNNPDGPKYPAGLEEKDLNKTVTRTITYVYADGTPVLNEDGTPKVVTQEAKFTREAKVNLVTGDVTYGDWTPAQDLAEVKSPVVKGFLADKASVAVVNVTGDSEDIKEVVTYKPLGSWVPNIPGQPTDPIKYPNDPTDPTKPGNDKPVLPYVPGMTPKDKDGNPLKPVDPNDPTKGYEVPNVPTNPGEDTPINYVKDTQKAKTTFVDEKGNPIPGVDAITEEGDSDTPLTKEADVKAKIKELENKGYELVSNTYPEGGKFDKDAGVDQEFKVTLKERVVPVTPDQPKTPGTPVDPNNPDGPKYPAGLEEKDLNKTVTRTITYVYEDGTPVLNEDGTPKTVTQEAKFTREAKVNLVTGEVTYGDWTPAQDLSEVTSPVVKGFVADKATVPTTKVTADSENTTEVVTYKPLGSWVPNIPGQPTDPIKYPNDPTDPTKPGNDKPVLPYVPGMTPKDKDGNPLKPVDPNDPTKGYEVPSIPTNPGEDTPINYVKDTQKAKTTFVDEKGNPIPGVDTITEEGDSDTPLTKEADVKAKIKELENKGYELVSNTYPEGGKFDKDKDTDQEFKVTLKERVVPVTPDQPKTPGTPVDPNNPDGPKYPAGLEEKDLNKTVTRTITYVYEDGTPVLNEDGTPKTVTQEAKFTREAKVNLVTGEVTYGDWTPAQDLAEVKSPVVKGFLADKVSVPVVNVTGDSEDIKEVVTYKPLGSWVPNIPGQPTDPIKYPNDPTDPTKPGNDKPVLPYVPGMIPKDKDGNPLKPVDPNDPTKGYEVPSIPTNPGEDTPINYVKDTQKAKTTFVDEKGNPIPGVDAITEEGDSDTPLTKEADVKAKIKELENKGYELVSNTYPEGGKFDKDKDTDQEFKVTFKERVVPVTPDQPKTPGTPVDPNNPDGPKYPAGLEEKDLNKTVTRTITYVYEDGTPVLNEDGTPKTVTQEAKFTREAKVNLVTGEVTYGDWTPAQDLAEVKSPVVKGFLADKVSVPVVNVTGDSEDIKEVVTYKPLGSWVPNIPGQPTDPIKYPNDPTDPTKPGQPTEVVPYVPGYTPKDKDGNPLKPVDPNDPTKGYEVPSVPTNPGEDTPINYVANKANLVVKYVDEKGKDLLPAETTEGKVGDEYATSGKVIKGYVLVRVDGEAKGKIGKDGSTVTYVYKPLGSWVPNIPGQPTDPIKYPNDPTDPTKPGKDKPVLPYVPGYTPKDKDGNPLKPVDPNDPTKGYEVPSVPTNPGEDTPINYVANKANLVVKYVDEKGKDLLPEETTEGKVGDEYATSGKVIKGYVLVRVDGEAKGKIGKDGSTVTYVYKPLGSWVPNIPGQPTDPIKYPNDPTDPTKPGKDKPVLPYVPGYTPKDKDGNPLKPVDPNDPTKGYEVPSVPTNPGEDTPINYVPNPKEAEKPAKPVQPSQPSTPKYVEGQKELPNTGTEANASLAALGLLGALGGFGLLARKKKED